MNSGQGVEGWQKALLYNIKMSAKTSIKIIKYICWLNISDQRLLKKSVRIDQCHLAPSKEQRARITCKHCKTILVKMSMKIMEYKEVFP